MPRRVNDNDLRRSRSRGEENARRSAQGLDRHASTDARRSFEAKPDRVKSLDPQQSRQARHSSAKKPRRGSILKGLAKALERRKMDKAAKIYLIRMGAMIVVGIGVTTGIFFGVQSIISKQGGFLDVQNWNVPEAVSTQNPRALNERPQPLDEPSVTPNPQGVRDISFGAKDIVFAEPKINRPGIFDTELLFSAGSGSIERALTKLYLYNLDTMEEVCLGESKMYMGEYYETHANHSWLVWLETDHGTNNKIWVRNRGTGKDSMLKNCKNGQPKLQLYGDTLIWMEQTSSTEDKLYMVDLQSQENLTLDTFTDKATYAVSAPCIYGNEIVWAGPDTNQSDAEKLTEEHSGIYYRSIIPDENGSLPDAQIYFPGTYVHEPRYNGRVFVWLDGNKSMNATLYMGRPGEEPVVVAKGVTTYSIGDDVVVYGKNQAVWVYIISTGELCRLTSPGETGMLPEVSRRTVVWYNLSADSEKDVLRYKILTDQDLYPGESN